MNAEAIPIIRFQIENLKHQIASHLGAVGSELGEAVENAVDKAVAEYDFDGEVSRIVSQVVSEELQAFYTYGRGRLIIREALDQALRKTHE